MMLLNHICNDLVVFSFFAEIPDIFGSESTRNQLTEVINITSAFCV